MQKCKLSKVIQAVSYYRLTSVKAGNLQIYSITDPLPPLTIQTHTLLFAKPNSFMSLSLIFQESKMPESSSIQ